MTTPLDDAALDRLFRTARSYNGYLDRPVAEDQLRAIWDLVKMAPTSANQLPARLVWCVSQESRDRLADCASGSNAAKIRKAPAAVVIGMDSDFHEHLPTCSRTSMRRAGSTATANCAKRRPSAIPRCKAPISSWRRARSGWIPAR